MGTLRFTHPASLVYACRRIDGKISIVGWVKRSVPIKHLEIENIN
jgi:hypothetical protein